MVIVDKCLYGREIVHQSVEEAFGDGFRAPGGGEHLQAVGVGDESHFHQHRWHGGIHIDVEVVGFDAPVGDGQAAHGGLVHHLGQQQVFGAFGVVVSGGAVYVAVGEGVDMDGNKGISVGFIGYVAAGLQFRIGVCPGAVHVFVGGACHDHFRTGGGEHVPKRQGDGEGDVLFVNFFSAQSADGAYIGAAVSGVNADDFPFQHSFSIGGHIDFLYSRCFGASFCSGFVGALFICFFCGSSWGDSHE